MNMFKKNGGFTLVELIVVIAILAILAGVAVPMYSGYITKANEASDMTQLDSIKTAAVFAVTEKDPGAVINTITVTAGEADENGVLNVTVDVTESEGVADITTANVGPYVSKIEFKSHTSYTLDLDVDQPKWTPVEE